MRISARRQLAASIGLMAMALAAPAWAADEVPAADNDSDPTITVTATRQPIKVEDAPVTVTVIDEKRIADELATDIKDLVRFEPGISVPRGPTRFGAALGTTGRAGNEGFTVRGIGGNRVLIQVDGVRVPDGFTFGAQSAGRGDYVDLGLVKSVEILRGPASALYGSDGLAGAVSFITADPADFLTGGKNIGGLARAAYSSADNEFSETAIIAGKAGSVSVMGAYTRRDYNELENKGTVGGTGTLRTIANPQDGESNAFLGRIVWEPGGGHKLRLTGEYLDSALDTNVLTGLSTTVDLLKAHDTGKRKRIAGDWIWQGSEGGIDYARISAYWQDAKDVQFTDEDRTPAADRERLNTFENRVIGASAEVRGGFSTGSVEHRLILGGDISKTKQQGLRDGVVPPAGETFPTRAFPVTDFTLAGAFLADEIKLGPVTFYPALRFDYYNLSPEKDPLLPTFVSAKQHGSRVSPKLGVVVKATDSIRLFANYAQGFKSPAPSQVNNFFENPAQGYKSIPNPNLRPETSKSFEGGVRFNNEFVSIDLTGFHAEYDNFIDQVETTGQAFPTPATPWIYQWVNLTGAEVSGAEGRISVRPAKGVSATLAVSYSEGDGVGATGVKTPLQSIDPLKTVLGVGYDDPGSLWGGKLILTYGGQKEVAKTLGSSCYATTAAVPNCFTGEDYVVFDITAYVRPLENLTIRAGLFNVTDKKYWNWSDFRGLAKTSTVKDAYTQPGRNGSVSIGYRF